MDPRDASASKNKKTRMSFQFPMSGPKIEFLLSPSRQNWLRNLPLKCRFMRTDDVFDVRKANYRWQKDRFMAGCLEWNTLPPLINCLVFDNKLRNYLSKNAFQFQNSQMKTQRGHTFSFGHVDFTWFFLIWWNQCQQSVKHPRHWTYFATKLPSHFSFPVVNISQSLRGKTCTLVII